MLKKNIFRSSLCLMALTLGACSMLQQPAAPTESGNNSTESGNIDNTPPYTPPADTAPAYIPPPVSTAATPAGNYVPNYSPVDINAATHTVQRGDTVYNIAKRYQITQDNVMTWNNLSDSTIKIGQVLKVKPAGYVAPAAAAGATATQPAATPPARPTASTTPSASVSPAKPTTAGKPAATSSSGNRTAGNIVWQRPTASNKILQGFGGTSKGVDYGGTLGQPIVAAADGKVVYAGSGLRGYGNLIIIQHNQTYLTAYGHNQTLMVKEGQQVKRGQQIATMGNSDAKRTQLHFELRENGTPMDPSKYLPM